MLYNEIELLAPAGSKESVTAAVNSGCNAVYMGGKSFNARAYASNFEDSDLEQIIDYCHLRGVKVLITLNILYKDTEINPVLDFVAKLYSYGADALIIQDIGLFNLIKTNFPKLKLSASTQLTTHNLSAVKKLEAMGFSRVVLSRELSIDEIRFIAKNKGDIELETFVHGALCVCYSGRCLMSSVIGGRSGNRGRCAQPCRMQYKLYKNSDFVSDGYLLSPKDISTIDILSDILQSGVKSLKIEGRMKSPEYVSEVVSVYRKYIDNAQPVAAEDKKELTQIFNRGGSSSQGYYTSWAGTAMMSQSPKSSGIKIGTVLSYNPKSQKCVISLTAGVIPGDGIEIWTHSPEHAGTSISKLASAGDNITLNIIGKISKGDAVYKSYDKALNDKLSKTYSKDTRQLEVSASVTALVNKPVALTLSLANGIAVSVEGDTVGIAQNQPVTSERLIAQLSKTGGTPFSFNFINTAVDSNIYIPMSALNSLRRDAIERLSAQLTDSFHRELISAHYSPKPCNKPQKSQLCVYVTTDEQFAVALNSQASRIYIELNEHRFKNADYYISSAHSANKELFMALPRIYRYTHEDKFSEYISTLEASSLDGYLVRNYGDIATSKQLAYDYTFNIYNHASLEYLSATANMVTLSPELTLGETTSLASNITEVYVYGRLPLMTTHQCPVGLYTGGKKSGKYCSQKGNSAHYHLTDRKNIDFPVLTDCENCVAEILNSAPIFLLDKFKDMLSINSAYYRVSLTTEDSALSAKLLDAYSFTLETSELNDTAKALCSEFKNIATHGHFYRGVL